MKKAIILFAFALFASPSFAQYMYSELIPWQNTVYCPERILGVDNPCPTFDKLCVDMVTACPPTEEWKRVGTPNEDPSVGVVLWSSNGSTEGIFTNFNFFPGRRYIIRVGVKSFDKVGSASTKLRLFAASNMVQSGTFPCCSEPFVEDNNHPNTVNSYWMYNESTVPGTPNSSMPQIDRIADVIPGGVISGGTTQMFSYAYTPTVANSQFLIYAHEAGPVQLNTSIDYILIEEDCNSTQFMYWGSTTDPYKFTFDGNYTEKNTHWELGDGNTAVTQYVTHDYGAPGNYTVCLKHENDFEHYCEYCRDICVNDPEISDPDGDLDDGNGVLPPCTPPHFDYQIFGSLFSDDIAVSPTGNYYDLVDIDYGDGSSITSVNQLTSYTHTYGSSGTYKICVNMSNSPSCKVCMDICINQPMTDSWGYAVGGGGDPDAKPTSFGSPIISTDKFEQLQVVPNPASSNVTLNFAVSEGDEKVVDIDVYDITGRKVLSKQTKVSIGVNAVGLDISALHSGIYIVNVKNGVNTIKSRIVKD